MVVPADTFHLHTVERLPCHHHHPHQLQLANLSTPLSPVLHSAHPFVRQTLVPSDRPLTRPSVRPSTRPPARPLARSLAKLPARLDELTSKINQSKLETKTADQRPDNWTRLQCLKCAHPKHPPCGQPSQMTGLCAVRWRKGNRVRWGARWRDVRVCKSLPC